MTTEDYVSFETAKLLKEKGFDGECRDYYNENGHFYSEDFKSNWNASRNKSIVLFSCPTLQMAMKWLREVHNIHIEIGYNMGYFPICISTKTNDTIPYIAMEKPFTYEKACEAAIKYCLIDLI